MQENANVHFCIFLGGKQMKQRVWLLELLQRRILIGILLLIQLAFIIYSILSNSVSSDIIRECLTAVSFFVSLAVLSSRGKGAYKTSLVFLILMFPLFGGIFYLFYKWQLVFRPLSKRLDSTIKQTQKFAALPACRTSYAISQAPEHANQIRYLEKCAQFPTYKDTKTVYFPVGEDMFSALIEEISRAER